jgi:hypothetical protein
MRVARPMHPIMRGQEAAMSFTRGACRYGLVLGVAATALATAEARAGQSTCGSTSAGWNVPAGDPVFVSGPGPIYSVLSAVGEYRSHSMLSNGPDGWVTHATSVTPPTNGDTSPYWTPFCSSCGSECWNPISPSFLTASMPGLESVSQGAVYNFLYSGSSNTTSGSALNINTINSAGGAGPGENFIAYQRSYDYAGTNATASAVNNISFGGTGMAWSGWWSGTGLGNNGESGDSSQYVWGRTYNGSQVHYGWYQYMNVQGTPQGVPGVNTGVVCSSSLALWQHDALTTKTANNDVLARTYSNLGTAANALWNGVQSECSATTGWFSSVGSFFTNLGWSSLCVGVTGYTQGVCSQAADQMVNCFAANNCGNTSSPGAYFGSYNTKNNGDAQWEAVVNGGAKAVGISPDDIACWNGNGTGAPCTGAGSSVWGWDASQTVQWNSGGNNYSCWD